MNTAGMTDPSTLRDRLAIQRTELANERTLLAYGRTGLMLTSTGAVVLKFLSPSVAVQLLGGVLIASGFALLGIGAYRFFRIRQTLLAGTKQHLELE